MPIKDPVDNNNMSATAIATAAAEDGTTPDQVWVMGYYVWVTRA